MFYSVRKIFRCLKRKWISMSERSGECGRYSKVSYLKSVSFCSVNLSICSQALSWSEIGPRRLTNADRIWLYWTCISIRLIFETDVPIKDLVKLAMYSSISSGSFLPCSVDIVNWLKGTMAKIEPTQNK